MAWGGDRRSPKWREQTKTTKPEKSRPQLRAEPKVKTSIMVAAEAKATEVLPPAIDPRAWAMMLPEIEEISRRYSKKTERTRDNSPFKLPVFPKSVTDALAARNLPTMAMDNALVGNLGFAEAGWLSGPALDSLPGEGLLFLGYTYLAELAQRPEYRVMSETIADDATREWIDFDVVGDEKQQKDDRDKDPIGYEERMADPDERKKRVDQAGKTDKVKALQDDQLRLEVKDRFYEQCRNDGFFGRSHLFLDVRAPGTEEMNPEELKSPIGDSRDAMSMAKVQKGWLQALRTIEPVWTYPLMYNAINPLRKDWYNPQVWFVMGQEIHGTRLQTFIGHPVPDMLKPAYSFGGLSLTQMAKPYVDIWLQTRQSVAALIHSFSVMVLMTDLSTLLQPNQAGGLIARAALSNILRDNQGLQVVNKNTEDFKNVSASLSGLHELQAQAQEHMASVHRIPLVKFTGIQPAGLNASSEGEIEVYDDTIAAYQARFEDPNLRRIINFQQLSLFGEIDPEITHRWNKLRPMTQAEKGTKEKDDADRNQKYVDMGALSPGEVRKIIIDDKELPYTGLNAEDVPESPAEEGLLGPGAGGAAKEFEAEHAPGGGSESDQGGGATDADHPFAHDAWNESDHPRGQPGNAGQFGAGGGGGGSKKPPQMGANSGGSRRQADAASLYKAQKHTPEQMKVTAAKIVAKFPGGAEAIASTLERLKSVPASDNWVEDGGHRVKLPGHTDEKPNYSYTPERLAVHQKIISDLFTPERIAAATPPEGEKPVTIMLGGRGGSGKSWITSKGPLAGRAISPEHPVPEGMKNGAIILDADFVKGQLPGYEGWKASKFHEESSDVLAAIDERARALGINVILDATMKAEGTVSQRMTDYEANGSEVEGYYMHLPPEEAATRAMARYAKGGKFNGRFVPPEVILQNQNNEANFDKLSKGFRKWAVYENTSKEPKLVSRSGE